MITVIAILITSIITLLMFISNIYGIALITMFRNLMLLSYIEIGGTHITSEGLITLLIILLGIYLSIKHRKPYFTDTAYNGFLLLIFVLMMETFIDYDQGQSYIKLLRIIGYMFLYLTIAKLSESVKNRKIILISIIASMLMTMTPAVMMVTTKAATGTTPMSGMMSKNNFGFYSCYMTLFSIFCFYSANKFTAKMMGIILTGGMAMSLLLSYTRTAWIAFFIALIVFLLFSRSTTNNLVLIISIVILGSLSSAIIYNGLYIDMNKKRAVGMNSFEWRYKYAWPAAIKSFQAKPIFGHGLGNNWKANLTYAKLNNSSHNDYLVILVETGIVGFISYILFLISLFYRSLRAIKYSNNNDERLFCLMSLTVFIAFMIGGIGEHLIQTPGATGYVITLLGMSHGIAKHNKSIKVDVSNEKHPVYL